MVRRDPESHSHDLKTSAEAESVPADKSVASRDKRIVVENDDSVPPVTAPRVPSPVIMPRRDGKANTEPDDGIDKQKFLVVSRIHYLGSPVDNPRIILGKIDDLWIRGFNDDRRTLRLHVCCAVVLRVPASCARLRMA